MSIDLDAIRARLEAATPGPWQWFGNTDVRNIYLASRGYGRQFVMTFARWGMQGAEPVFVQGRTWKADPQGLCDFRAEGFAPARDIVRYEVAPSATSRQDPGVYRADIAGLRNPDAVFIAAARQDAADLLAEVDRLRAELAERAA